MLTNLITLNTIQNTKLDIPIDSIRIVEEEKEGKGCTVIYDLGNGNLSDKIADAYGFVRKKLQDVKQIPDGLELNVVHGPDVTHRIYQSASNIVARRELKDHPDGANCRITLVVNCKPFEMDIKETRDEIAGEA